MSTERARRLEPDERREQILECAIRLFGERPYSAVSTTELANEAGVTRGLLHHYFGTKRGLYVEVVRRMLFVPKLEMLEVGDGRDQVEVAVDWFLDSVSPHGKTFIAVWGAEGVGDDPEIGQMLADADDLAARKVLETLGIDSGIDSGGPAGSRDRALIRAYGGLVKGSVREWVREGNLTRDDVRLLLIESLRAIVSHVVPAVTTR
jgi:AcrR family transcriptional regulator